jgi:hypothetical protein
MNAASLQALLPRWPLLSAPAHGWTVPGYARGDMNSAGVCTLSISKCSSCAMISWHGMSACLHFCNAPPADGGLAPAEHAYQVPVLGCLLL